MTLIIGQLPIGVFPVSRGLLLPSSFKMGNISFCERCNENKIIWDMLLYSYQLQLLDQFSFMGNCPPTPALSVHFALGEK